MTIAEIMKKMIAYSKGNFHDIDHLIRVWTYAKTIGELEGLDGETQYILEVAAITHDIACPFCREAYGNTNGPNQEREGARLVREFLQDTGMPQAQASENGYAKEVIQRFLDKFCKTVSGAQLLRAAFCLA